MNQEEEQKLIMRSENQELRHMINNSIEQIQRLKEVNEHHEAEIETLLKFNQRLLTIIETELTQYKSKKSERSFSLQPISQITQITERDTEYMGNGMSIKASLISNFRLQIPQIQERYDYQRSTDGRQTERLAIGNYIEDATSYEGAKSDYQREYSEYSKPQKMREVLSLVSAYRGEYGKSRKQYDEMKKKMRKDLQSSNNEMEKMNSSKINFFEQKMARVEELKKKVAERRPEKELQNMVKLGQYSVETRNTLMKVINSLN